MNLIEQIASSDVFFAIVTKNYLHDVKQGDTRIPTQLALDMNKAVFLLMEDSLDQEEVAEARELFSKHRVIKEYLFNIENLTSIDDAVRDIKAWLDAGNR